MNPGPLIKSKPATRAQNRPVPGTASKRIARPCGVRWLGARAVLDARAAFERLVKRSIEAAREQRPAPTLFAPETPHRPQLKLAPQARLRGPKSMRKPSPPKRLSDQPNPGEGRQFRYGEGRSRHYDRPGWDNHNRSFHDSLSVGKAKVTEWISRTVKDNRDRRDRKIFDMWLACHTQKKIAEACGCPRQTVADQLQVLPDRFSKTESAKAAASYATDFDRTTHSKRRIKLPHGCESASKSYLTSLGSRQGGKIVTTSSQMTVTGAKRSAQKLLGSPAITST
jgi:hypothetical protein